MGDVSFFFAGGGTGGHLYPALAVAEQIVARRPEARIHFLCSMRPIDKRILDTTSFQYAALPATGLYFDPKRLLRFFSTFRQSYKQAKAIIAGRPNSVVIGAGGFVAAPVCMAGHKLGVPVAVVNVDIVAGRANRLSARWADEIFVQFEEVGRQFQRMWPSRPRLGSPPGAGVPYRVNAVGCPLRSGFARPQPERAVQDIGLEAGKKVLLVTGASSGSANINEAIGLLLGKLERFADTWQIVHLTGLDSREAIAARYESVRISHRVLDYYDGMPDLFAAADLVIGRSGAVSVAEYAVAGVPSICLPYPYHKDRHQYLNAAKLVEAGAAVIVDDVADAQDRADGLWGKLEGLMADDKRRRLMAEACRQVARPQAAGQIAQRLLAMAGA